MHLFGISVFCLALFYANLALEASHDYYDYDQDQGDAMVSTGKIIFKFYVLKETKEIGLMHHLLLVMICCPKLSMKLFSNLVVLLGALRCNISTANITGTGDYSCI